LPCRLFRNTKWKGSSDITVGALSLHKRDGLAQGFKDPQSFRRRQAGGAQRRDL
jgi:hypothetical protein